MIAFLISYNSSFFYHHKPVIKLSEGTCLQCHCGVIVISHTKRAEHAGGRWDRDNSLPISVFSDSLNSSPAFNKIDGCVVEIIVEQLPSLSSCQVTPKCLYSKARLLFHTQSAQCVKRLQF